MIMAGFEFGTTTPLCLEQWLLCITFEFGWKKDCAWLYIYMHFKPMDAIQNISGNLLERCHGISSCEARWQWRPAGNHSLDKEGVSKDAGHWRKCCHLSMNRTMTWPILYSHNLRYREQQRYLLYCVISSSQGNFWKATMNWTEFWGYTLAGKESSCRLPDSIAGIQVPLHASSQLARHTNLRMVLISKKNTCL